MQRPPRRFAALCASALVLVACTSGDPGSITPVPTSAASAVSIAGLRATQPDRWAPSGRGWAITLGWSAPLADTFEVRRDGVLLADELSTPGYRDVTVDPGTTYRYAVVGSSTQGASSSAATVTVSTGEPEVAEARLQGSFLVRMRVVGSSGLSADPSSGDLLFRYAPACAIDACDVRWTVRAHVPSARLARTRGHYRGQARGPFLIRSCSGGAIAERIQTTTRVTAAGPVRHAWRVTRVNGTLTETGSAPGCAVASITWAFAGVIQT